VLHAADNICTRRRRQDAHASGRGDADARVGQPDADAPRRDAAARAGDPQLGPHQVRGSLRQPALWMGVSNASSSALTVVKSKVRLECDSSFASNTWVEAQDSMRVSGQGRGPLTPKAMSGI